MRATIIVASLIAFRVTAVQRPGWALTPTDVVTLVQVTLVNATFERHAAALASGSKFCCCYVRSRCGKKADCVPLREKEAAACPTAKLAHGEFVPAETCVQRLMGHSPIGKSFAAVQESHPAYDAANFCEEPELYKWLKQLADRVFKDYDKDGDHKLSKVELAAAFSYIIEKEVGGWKGFGVKVTLEDLQGGLGDAGATKHDFVVALMRKVKLLGKEPRKSGTDPAPSVEKLPGYQQSTKNSVLKETTKFESDTSKAAPKTKIHDKSTGKSKTKTGVGFGSGTETGRSGEIKKKVRAAENPDKHFLGLRDLSRKILRAIKMSRA